MISKKDLIARAKARENINNNIPNPYNLNRKQLDELEITKAQLAEHLKNVDFSEHHQPPAASNSELNELERKADIIRKFVSILKEGGR